MKLGNTFDIFWAPNRWGLLMAGIMVIINVLAVVVNYGKTQASGYAVASLIASIWALGIFSNFRSDPQNAPSYAVLLSTGAGITGLVTLIFGLTA